MSIEKKINGLGDDMCPEEFNMDTIIKNNTVERILCDDCQTIYDMPHIGNQLDVDGRKLYGWYTCPQCNTSVAGNHTIYFVNKYLKGDWSKLKHKMNKYDDR